MTLLDRISRKDDLPHDERMAGHLLENGLKLYFHGKVTRPQIINFLRIPSQFESDFDKFKTKFDGFANNPDGIKEQNYWVQDLEGCVIGIQTGYISKANFNSILGLTLDVN